MRALHPLVLLALVPALAGCPPVRDDGTPEHDDDDDVVGGDARSVWEATEPGACDVVPDNDILLSGGAGTATVGLWYALDCVWTGATASSITIEVAFFDERAGGDYAVLGVTARDLGGEVLPMEGDLGSVHVEPGEGERFNGWWLGELEGFDAAGGLVFLDLVAFRDAPVQTVVGR